ncbi:MAG: hypothetical protein F2840_11110 [Actinobacteria bacterium]|uniref:Unannotated protein n=1 Tax=freshwater metagenome TaxID=449393 RepID=A0A6J7L0I4_9ZZZZ|nr:hypothetical protein [Actinomycetota bacterium]
MPGGLTAVPGSARLHLLPDLAIILGISVFSAFLSGSRQWAGFNSPDSEFYASLALFGSDVTDRAIEPAYTWTRLGYIAPVRLLVTAGDPWVGFALWRFLLILVIVGSTYLLVKQASNRVLAIGVALFASLNTMVLSYVGNPYLTGAIMAATTLFLALAAWCNLGESRARWLPGALSGVVAGWLVMLNPYALFLALSMWLAVRAVGLFTDHEQRLRRLLVDAGAAAVGFAVSIAGFLAAGAVIFPGRSWLGTYLDWNGRLDYASFISDPNIWTRDVTLFVPAAALIISLIALAATRANRWSLIASAIAGMNILFTWGYLLLVPGPWLEAPHYTAKLWPGALVSIGLAFAAIVGDRRLGPIAYLPIIAGVPLVLWAGRWEAQVTLNQGLLITGGFLLAFVLAAIAARGPSDALAALVVMGALVLIATGAQILQNGRGQLGIYGQYPFRAAYVDFNGELLMRAKVKAEEWVLEHTERTDRIAIWTDPDRAMSAVAAMQLWGKYNLITGNGELSREEVKALEILKPTAIAMYAPKREQIDTFWASLPAWALPTTPECTTVTYLGVGEPEPSVCVTHLTWLN